MPHSRTPVGYISGPITLGDKIENIRQATVVFRKAIDAGMSAWCPHWSHLAELAFPEILGDMTHAQWMANDLPFVRRMDWLVRLPGESVGADQEVAEARSVPRIRIYTSIDTAIADRDGM